MVKYIERQPLWLMLLEASVLLAGVGAIDIATGYRITLFPFYGLAIGVAAWLCGEKWGYAFALLAGGVWWFADLIVNHPYESYPVQLWETTIRLMFFVLVAVATLKAVAVQRSAAARIALLERSAQLESQVVEISEYEQTRIGRDLHDGLCQFLAAVACSAASLQKELDRRGSAEEAAAAAQIGQLINEAVLQARNLARGLVPVPMEEAGLECALEELTSSTSGLLGITCRFDSAGWAGMTGPGEATHLYRIAQESINNAHKHGRAKHIEVRLSSDSELTILTIADDGVGMADPNVATNGIGLSTMRYRANIIGGELEIENRRAGGTVVSCIVPRSAEAKSLNAAA